MQHRACELQSRSHSRREREPHVVADVPEVDSVEDVVDAPLELVPVEPLQPTTKLQILSAAEP